MTIYIMRGYSGSGKTTYAKMYFPNVVRASRDSIRKALTGREEKFAGTYDFETMVTNVQETIIRKAVKQGRDVVVDDTNLHKKFAIRWVDLAAKLKAPYKVIDLKVDLDTCLIRNAARPYSVPESVIKSQAKNSPLDSWPELVPTVGVRPELFEPYSLDPSLPPTIVVDIDGTVAELAKGYSPYDPEHYPHDKPIQPVINLVLDLVEYHNSELVFLTGRDEAHRKATEAWLSKHIRLNPSYYSLYMRPTGDRRPDYIVKNEMFEEHVAPHFGVIACVDDRRQVVDMYRSKGLLVLDVAGNEF